MQLLVWKYNLRIFVQTPLDGWPQTVVLMRKQIFFFSGVMLKFGEHIRIYRRIWSQNYGLCFVIFYYFLLLFQHHIWMFLTSVDVVVPPSTMI